MGPYAKVDFNLPLCRLQHIYHGQPYGRVDRSPMPESISPSQGLRIWPLPYIGPPLSFVCAGAGRTGLNMEAQQNRKKFKNSNRIVKQNVATKSADFSETIVFILLY
jgi:hypothetical protein